jgi:hypothetical protein
MDGPMQNLSLQETKDLTSLVDLLYEKQDTRALRRNIILHYCDTMLGTREGENAKTIARDKGSYRYDPKQSLFMYGLCVHIDEVSK